MRGYDYQLITYELYKAEEGDVFAVIHNGQPSLWVHRENRWWLAGWDDVGPGYTQLHMATVFHEAVWSIS